VWAALCRSGVRRRGVAGRTAGEADTFLAAHPAPPRIRPPARRNRPCAQGAIASAYPLASQAGQEILAAGGNAFDAGRGGVGGTGGGRAQQFRPGERRFYLLHRQSDGFETMVDAREKAPGAASRDMYLDKSGNEIANASTNGPLSAAIPGEPAAFEYLARKYGKLP